MANCEEEQFSSEENLTLEELRNKLAQLNIPESGVRSVLVARLNRAYSTGQPNPKESANGKKTTEKQGSGAIPKTKRDRDEDESLEKLRTKELREHLASMGLETRGRKAELRVRLQAAMEEEDTSSEEESDDESETEDDEEDERESKRNVRGVYQKPDKFRRKTRRYMTVSFQDVQDALEVFTGENNENINQWFEAFEETASMCRWTKEQKIIYAKKLMKGSAKIFVNYECHARTWHELKEGLIREFSKKFNTLQVHRKLQETKKRDDEGCMAYMYRMLEIASHVDMEEEAKIEYVIDGIVDEEVHKSMLYGAASIKELRKKLTAYEEQKSRRTKSVAKSARIERNNSPSQCGSARKTRCYNCGDKEHVSAGCPNRSRGPKCFKCREYGHIASKCDNLSESIKKVGSMFRLLSTKRGKDVKIGNFELSALIDTGNELTLMRYNQYVRIGAPKLSRDIIEFHSIGSKRNFTFGKFPTDIIIDGELYHITIHVVPKTAMQHSLLIGTDFLDTVEINMKRGDISISRIEKRELRWVSRGL